MRAGRVPIYAILGLWTLVCLFPIYWFAVTSLKGGAEIGDGPYYLPFADFTPSWDAWIYILGDRSERLLKQYFNSAAVALASTALTVSFAGLALYGLTRLHPPRSANGIMLAMLATRILPPAAVVLPIYVLAATAGMLDTLSVLILTYTAANLPVALWLMRPVLGTVASDQEESARLDLVHRLNAIPGVAIPEDKTDLWPPFPLAALTGAWIAVRYSTLSLGVRLG